MFGVSKHQRSVYIIMEWYMHTYAILSIITRWFNYKYSYEPHHTCEHTYILGLLGLPVLANTHGVVWNP
jgi:hypothetical protein